MFEGVSRASKQILFGVLGLGAIVLPVLPASSQQQDHEQVGSLPGGGFLLNSGWRLTPAGVNIGVDTLPMNAVATPDGAHLLVLNGGFNPPSVSIVDIKDGKETGHIRLPDAWLGLTINHAGDKVYIGGGSQAAVYELSLKDGSLSRTRTLSVISEEERKKLDGENARLEAAHESEYSVATQTFVGDVELSPDERYLYATDLYHDSVVAIDRQSGKVVSRIKTGRRPYRVIVGPSGRDIYVSSWTDGTVSRYEVKTGARLQFRLVGPHTTDMAWRSGSIPGHPSIVARLFVSASNTNDVFVLGVDRAGTLSPLETINLAITPRQPLGTTPSAMGLSADGRFLFVACSDINAAAIIDVSGAESRVIGLAPTGWYPTKAFGLADGRMAVLNGRGLRSYPNPGGPNPTSMWRGPEFIQHMQTGTVQLVELGGENTLLRMTLEVRANSPYKDTDLTNASIPPSSPIRPDGPIKHVIYIIKENRTYDQVLGDIAVGNGDPSLVLFGKQVTPNQHQIARQFVLLDNFYVNADSSCDGHEWAVGAISSDYTQRLFQNTDAFRRLNSDFGDEPTDTLPGGEIWKKAIHAGISMRNYGWLATNLKAATSNGTQIAHVSDPLLASVTNSRFRAFDFKYSDVDRTTAFIDDIHQFEKTGRMPQFMLIWLPNDHTAGTTPGLFTPLSYVADNDLAVGMVVEALSASPFWNETAIFIVEDDSQGGPDHVDSHRSTAYVISPWVRHGVVDSTFYNQTSVLRTIEIILGLSPMTVYDAGSRPMFDVFSDEPNAQAYTLIPPQVSPTQRNPTASPTSAMSKRMDFSVADDIDDEELNDLLWKAIKGANVPPPVPMRSAFSNEHLFQR